MSRDDQDTAASLRATAERLAAPFAAFEATCLQAGLRLGEAIPGLNRLSETFESVAGLLQGPAMAAASRDLETIAHELAAAAGKIGDEGRGLDELVRLNKDIGPQVETLQTYVRTVAALVFTLKIESAQLPGQSEEMIAFAERLQQLAERARGSLADFHKTQARLDLTLRSSATAHAGFEQQHLKQISQTADEILHGLGAVAERRTQAAGALKQVGALSQAIGERIGACVVGLQIGDSTRQRVEHIAFALDFAAQSLDEGRAEVAARTLALQSRQVEATRSEFQAENDKISASLEALGVDARGLEERNRQLFGHGAQASGSFLEAIGRQLSAAEESVKQGLQARAKVDEAKSAFALAMTELTSRTAGLLEMAADVGMIGANASLRSTRLGDAGRGVTVIAAELREFGRQIRATVAELAAALGRVAAFVDRFAAAQDQLDSARLTELGRRMASAVEIFDSYGRAMSDALAALGSQAIKAREALAPAAQALAGHGALTQEFACLASEIGEHGGRLGGGVAADAETDRRVDERLRPLYSMAAERRVHDRFAGRTTEATDDPAPVELADAFML